MAVLAPSNTIVDLVLRARLARNPVVTTRISHLYGGTEMDFTHLAYLLQDRHDESKVTNVEGW